MTNKRDDPAVVTDGGSVAAHASPVAREYGIPAVVGVSRATHRLQTGQRVRVDGTLVSESLRGSIHKVGAELQGADACNGWTFWHFEDEGALQPIDALRQEIRKTMAVAGA